MSCVIWEEAQIRDRDSLVFPRPSRFSSRGQQCPYSPHVNPRGLHVVLPEFLWAVHHHSYSANEEVWLTFNSPINTQSYFSSKWASRLFSGLCYSLEILESAFGVHQQHPDEIFKLELPWIDFRKTEISTILLPAIMKMILSFWLNLL